MSTLEDPDFMSHGFHLDCRLDASSYSSENRPSITVDGVDGYVFDTVSVNARTSSLSNTPIIASENEMDGSIFEDVKTRKAELDNIATIEKLTKAKALLENNLSEDDRFNIQMAQVADLMGGNLAEVEAEAKSEEIA